MTPASSQPRVPREIWVLIYAAFAVALGFGLVAPLLPQYAQSFGVGIGAASIIVSAFAFMRLAFAPVGGKLINIIGERLVYMIGLSIVALSSALVGFAPSYELLVVFRAFGGIGSTMFTVSAMALIVRLTPAELRGRTSAMYGTAFLLGNVGGPVLGTLLSGLGYRLPFLIYAAAIGVAIAVVGFFLRGAGGRADVKADQRPSMTLAEAVRDSAYRSAVLSNFAQGWANFGVRNSLLPLFAAAVPAIGAPMAGLGLTSFAVGNAVMLQFSGRLVDKRGRKPVLMTGLLVSGTAHSVFGFSTTLAAFLGISVVAGMGAALIAPSQQAVVADVVGRERNAGPVMAAFTMASDFGSIMGPIVTGFVADAVGFEWAFAMTGAIMVVALVGWVPGRETLPAEARQL